MWGVLAPRHFFFNRISSSRPDEVLEKIVKLKADDLGCCQVAVMVNGVKINEKSREMMLKDLFATDKAPKEEKTTHMKSKRRVGMGVNKSGCDHSLQIIAVCPLVF